MEDETYSRQVPVQPAMRQGNLPEVYGIDIDIVLTVGSLGL